ncbi:MAG: signal transduction histidine kinase, nitrogen specific, NtrB [Bryobacterales bacterium]|nr:signal transduction histidine kinase, nitrogen specific, NtrB [Bryobacterales bacterium]
MTSVPRLSRFVRAQDLVLVVLFAAIAALSPSHDVWEIGMIAALGVLQIAEPKIPFVSTTAGKVLWILLKLAIAYLLIGLTGGVSSSYYLMLLLPIISAATAMDLFPTLLFSLLACGAYLSFLEYIDWSQSEMEPDQVRILVLRLLFLVIAGALVNALALALREQSARHQAVAERLTEAEAAVRRSERLAALGQLSAGLAHELRNPLGTIRASAEILSNNLPPENALATEMAGFISSEVDRTNSLVTRFLDFARPLQLRREAADVAQVIDRAIALVKRENNGILILRNYSPALAPFPIDADLMEHVFYNLLLNAVQASSPGGTVTVTTRRTDHHAEVAVADRGVGIEPKLMETIFNPFVTTKPTGVGLGLPIVSKIVDEHGGTLAVDSQPGQGSTFRVCLPLQSA